MYGNTYCEVEHVVEMECPDEKTCFAISPKGLRITLDHPVYHTDWIMPPYPRGICTCSNVYWFTFRLGRYMRVPAMMIDGVPVSILGHGNDKHPIFKDSLVSDPCVRERLSTMAQQSPIEEPDIIHHFKGISSEQFQNWIPANHTVLKKPST